MDYAGLQLALVAWLNKPDIEQMVPTFIAFAEAEFNRDLRTQKQLKRATATSNAQFVELPDDWLEAKQIQLNGTGNPAVLHYRTMDQIDRSRDLLTDAVAYYSIFGNQLELLPAPSANVTLEMTYFRTIPTLSDSVTTNWLIETSPDLYLYGSLVHASPFLGEDPRLLTWQAGYDRAKQSLTDGSARALISGSPLTRKFHSFG